MLDERDENGYTLREREESKTASVKDGAAWALMVGAGESYVNPFAISLGADAGLSGILQTVPQFLGALAQLAALPLASRMKRRNWTLAAGAFLQALIWIPLALIAWFAFPQALPVVLVLFCIYQVFGQVINPGWSAWMAELVVPSERSAYFATRSRVSVLVQLLSMLGAGLALDRMGLPVGEGFALLFLFAFGTRAVSAFYLSKMADRTGAGGSAPSSRALPVGHVPDWGTYVSAPGMAESRRFTMYVGALMTATYIASPFFDIYMLTVLKMDYTTWSILTAVSTLAKFFFFNYWGRVIDRFGNRAVLFGTGFLVPVVSLLWVFDHSFGWLFFAQIFSGIAWSGFELAAFNYTISTPDASMRTAQSAAYNFAKGTGTMVGMFMGWGVLAIWPGAGLMGLTPFLALFFISAMGRYAASAYFLPRFSAHTFEGGMDGNRFLWEVLAAQPGRRMGRHLVDISELTIRLAQTGAGRGMRAAKEVGEAAIGVGERLKRGR
ncbi:MAG: MFS transporter [Candidatus Micrarchaeota archaeon]